MDRTPELRRRAEVVALCLEYGLMTVREAVELETAPFSDAGGESSKLAKSAAF